MRKSCKECPWHTNTQHNTKFKGWFKNMNDQDIIKGNHRCHMIDAKNIWVNPTEDNVCKGKKDN